jgi:hypothetical protein
MMRLVLGVVLVGVIGGGWYLLELGGVAIVLEIANLLLK